MVYKISTCYSISSIIIKYLVCFAGVYRFLLAGNNEQ